MILGSSHEAPSQTFIKLFFTISVLIIVFVYCSLKIMREKKK